MLYGELFFVTIAAQELGPGIIEPPLDWIAMLSHNYCQRDIIYTSHKGAHNIPSELLFKPADGRKRFEADIYTSGAILPAAMKPEKIPVLVSEVVTWTMVDCPPAMVKDVGLIEGRDWAVIEVNPTCSAAIYGCDQVLKVLKRACVPAGSSWTLERQVLNLAEGMSNEQSRFASTFRCTGCSWTDCSNFISGCSTIS